MPYTTSSDTTYEWFCEVFAEEIERLAKWLNSAPESIDIESHFEQLMENHDFDASDDGAGTNWDWVQELFEDHSPRLRAARIAREQKVAA